MKEHEYQLNLGVCFGSKDVVRLKHYFLKNQNIKDKIMLTIIIVVIGR